MDRTPTDLRQYQYDRRRVSSMIAGDENRARGALRGWFRQGLISGARQREKNAAIKFNAIGVVEAWNLWADHAGLEPLDDMPAPVKELKAAISQLGSAAEIQFSGIENTVTIVLPPGISLKVIHAA